MREIITLAAELRETLGTGPARALRLQGKVPAIVYGAGKKQLAIAIQEKEITKLYRKPGFSTAIIQIEVEGKKHKVLPKAVELHPTTDLVRHADFIFLGAKEQRLDVPVFFDGKERANGIKKGGFFNIIKRKVTLICPVDSIPEKIRVDVTNMAIGSSLRAGRLPIPAGCKLDMPKDAVIASITGRGGKAEAETETEATAEGK
ncbi:MAG: ribosomal protein L25/ral stress protein Ctc [Rickettsiaceae bacterium]|jgi:large subunit ribosomal protein L25|nr:ribosomal protein L25/ral stress protein Ctc [Rickettsiaceae bacterium]